MKRNLTLIFILTMSTYGIDYLYSRMTLNQTKSNPYHLFWISDSSFHKGGYVMFHSPDPKITKSLVKSVGCINGDTLENRNGFFYCNDKWIATALNENEKLNNNSFQFNGKIPQGYFFALGTHPRSYDSRYFGLVAQKDTQTVTPIL